MVDVQAQIIEATDPLEQSGELGRILGADIAQGLLGLSQVLRTCPTAPPASVSRLDRERPDAVDVVKETRPRFDLGESGRCVDGGLCQQQLPLRLGQTSQRMGIVTARAKEQVDQRSPNWARGRVTAGVSGWLVVMFDSHIKRCSWTVRSRVLDLQGRYRCPHSTKGRG
jgi:hypothetical protein